MRLEVRASEIVPRGLPFADLGNPGLRCLSLRIALLDLGEQLTQERACISHHADVRRIVTAKLGRIHVAGGYTLSTGRKSPYSSAGPARGGSRLGPDFALPTDESCALHGIRGGGNRSGAVFRLTGTSTAAPQLARDVTDAAPLQPTNIPGTPSEIGKRGGGNLAPP